MRFRRNKVTKSEAMALKLRGLHAKCDLELRLERLLPGPGTANWEAVYRRRQNIHMIRYFRALLPGLSWLASLPCFP